MLSFGVVLKMQEEEPGLEISMPKREAPAARVEEAPAAKAQEAPKAKADALPEAAPAKSAPSPVLREKKTLVVQF